MQIAPTKLYLIEILHQTTTWQDSTKLSMSCILSKFYIKPQLRRSWWFCCRVVSYRNSTSNHNATATGWKPFLLYLIEILHQTTTGCTCFSYSLELYLIEILHQTTTLSAILVLTTRCILSKFYIKPQPSGFREEALSVVSYRNSTSNHNGTVPYVDSTLVVSYRNSTSNHNGTVPYVDSTLLYLIEILHQTTTVLSVEECLASLYLIEILHQTTTILSISII